MVTTYYYAVTSDGDDWLPLPVRATTHEEVERRAKEAIERGRSGYSTDVPAATQLANLRVGTADELRYGIWNAELLSAYMAGYLTGVRVGATEGAADVARRAVLAP